MKWNLIIRRAGFEVFQSPDGQKYRVVWFGRTRLFEKETARHDMSRYIRDKDFSLWSELVSTGEL